MSEAALIGRGYPAPYSNNVKGASFWVCVEQNAIVANPPTKRCRLVLQANEIAAKRVVPHLFQGGGKVSLVS
ncbi:MAG: hypothetical protein ABSH28_24860 [Acidobacteriota bacterium]|jgi:hypothetical protein